MRAIACGGGGDAESKERIQFWKKENRLLFLKMLITSYFFDNILNTFNKSFEQNMFVLMLLFPLVLRHE